MDATIIVRDPYETPVFSGCSLAAYAPLRLIRSESVSRIVAVVPVRYEKLIFKLKKD